MPRKPTREQLRHPVSRYAQDVLAGRLVAGHYLRRVAQRHLDDLQREDLIFDVAAATRAMSFFTEFLRHPDGSRFALLPWQAFTVGQLFGWKTGAVRRFRYLYLSSAKGAGKSPLVSGIALAAWFLDDEQSAELYCAATTKEQSMVQYRDCARMARSAPALAKQLEIGEYNMARPATGSFLRPISSEGRALDGKRVSVALLDEIQEHPSADVLDKMLLGVKSRPQPIVCITGNAGYGRETPAGHLHEFCRRILDDGAQHDSWLPLIFALDPCPSCRAAGHWQPAEACEACDQWTDEAVWEKSNPSLETVLPRTYLRDAVREALDRPAKQAYVMRLNFALWTAAEVRWLPADTWAACGTPVDPESLKGRSCTIGVDLGESLDMTAIVAVFGDESTGYDIQPMFLVAEEGLDERAKRDRAPYREWLNAGLLEAVPGPVVRFEVVRERIKEWAGRYAVREIAVDKWRARQLLAWLLDDALPAVEMAPTLGNIAPAAATLERVLKTGMLRHGNHAVLNWNAANAVADTDALGNTRPSKARSGGRIDGLAALLLALARAMATPPEVASVYESRGVITV
jgi:phage terminase large subunit-like protein